MRMRLLHYPGRLADQPSSAGYDLQEQNTVDPEVRQQIEAAHMKFYEAYKNQDAAAVAALFTQDAVEVFQGYTQGGLACGQQAIKKRYEVDSASGSSVEGKIVQVYAIGNDVNAHAEYESERHHTGHAATIYVREADEWKIRVHYAN